MDFDEFYRKSYRRIVGQLFTVTGVLSDAEDIAQEAFLAASRAWETIGRYENPEAWVRRVSLNHASNLRRRAARKSRALIRLAGGQRNVESLDSGVPELTSALTGIPLRYRVVLTLHYLLDLPVSAIAIELNLPESTVKTRLARGRVRLRNHLIQQGVSAHD